MDDSRKVTLTKIKIGAIHAISKHLIDADVVIDDMIDYYELSIKGFLLGEEAAEKAVTYPADWWQAFKERWFPKPLLAFWPVRYTTVIMNADVVYPDFRPACLKKNTR